MVDAADLKSAVPEGTCGFETLPEHGKRAGQGV
jgi:hypothetical protein